MLGRFLGFSIEARRRAASFDFYRSLGFEPVAVDDGDAVPYAAFSDGTVAIGLHDAGPFGDAGIAVEAPGPVPTFVRPNLQTYVRGLRRLGIELELERLAADEFNQVAFCDPDGHPIRLVEARTFSPGAWNSRNVAACGEFLELSIAARAIGHSQTFWQALGFETVARGDDPHPWIRLAGHGLVIGLHERAPFAPGLTFHARHLAARYEYLKAKGLDGRRGGPLAAAPERCVTLLAPEGTPLYLLDAGDGD
ncbi:MAG TPA: hypothetical protein VF322_05250 [Gammaproteobacteria bacterium]